MKSNTFATNGDDAEFVSSKKGTSSRKGVDMPPEVETIGDVTIATVHLDQLDASNSEDFRRDMAPILQDCRTNHSGCQHPPADPPR